MVQWDKDSCADAGFLKIDLLGLGMLSAVERCVEQIARVRHERIDLSRIPFDDPDVPSVFDGTDFDSLFSIPVPTAPLTSLALAAVFWMSAQSLGGATAIRNA